MHAVKLITPGMYITMIIGVIAFVVVLQVDVPQKITPSSFKLAD